jgi:preprotein translocase subunit SecD
LRWAKTAPGDDLIEMTLPRSEEKVYVHPAPIVTAEDIADAYASTSNGITFEINVTFTKQAAERLAKFTGEHIGEMLAVNCRWETPHGSGDTRQDLRASRYFGLQYREGSPGDREAPETQIVEKSRLRRMQ